MRRPETALAMTVVVMTFMGSAEAAPPAGRHLVGHLNPHFDLSTSPVGESLLNLNGSVGYRFLTRTGWSMVALGRGEAKRDPEGDRHFWNNSQELAVGLQLRLREVVVSGVEVGHRWAQSAAPGVGAGRFFRAYTGHWQRFTLAPRWTGHRVASTPVITHSSSVSYNQREASLVASATLQVSLHAAVFGSHARLGPSVEARLSTDTAGLPWYRYVEYGAGIEGVSSFGEIPLYGSVALIHRSALHPSGRHGTFTRVTVGVWKHF
jgi:hypothetical protein